jgi:NADH:ubiquinone oxidoreductase subunit 6 (subunit J)
MFTSAFLIIDLGVEFLAFAYLIIYIGAIAVMFLFVIVTVDPKFENQKDTFEKTVIPALTLNNFLTFIIYFFISSSNMASGPYDHNNFYL